MEITRVNQMPDWVDRGSPICFVINMQLKTELDDTCYTDKRNYKEKKVKNTKEKVRQSLNYKSHHAT